MMPEFAYFLKVNLAFVLFYAFYRLFFNKDTFFKLRRFLLLGFFALALLYPFMNMQDWIKEKEQLVEIVYYAGLFLPEVEVLADNPVAVDWKALVGQMIGILYLVIVAVLILRFFVQLSSILWMGHRSEKQLINGYTVYAMSEPAGPFSFFNRIFLHPESHSEKEKEEILTHEYIHVSQMHSIDVIVSELMCILCWCNPFVWLLKREVRHNLEYLADNGVIQSGYDSKVYQYHLLGLAHHQQFTALYNNFNVLHLKNRIVMMNKKRSRGWMRTKYLVFIPLVLCLMLLSNIEVLARMANGTKMEMETIIEQMPESVLPETELVTAKEESQIEETAASVREEVAAPIREEVATPIREEVETIYTIVEKEPQFPGGEEALLAYLNSSINYPESAKEKGIQGRVVAQFVVSKRGEITQPEIIRGVDPVLDAEAIRVIKNMPNWMPGRQGEQVLAVRYTLPITFRLSEEEELDQTIFTIVEKAPEFPGGQAELLKWLGSTIKYPVLAQENGIQGRVTCQFVVNRDGSVVDAVVLRGVDPSLDREALRIISLMPKWAPGEQRGKPVRVKYTLPVVFRLQ